MRSKSTRRRFLQVSSATAVGYFAAGRIKAADPVSPNERLAIAVIGVTGQASASIDKIKHDNIVALCDVDENNLNKVGSNFPKARRHTDYRKMLDEQKDFDAVLVSVPDHHHAPASLAALALGKHLYCEKPLAHTLREIRLMRDAAKRAKVSTQMGTQIHAEENYRRVVELVRAGAIGPINRVHVWVDGYFHGGKRPADMPPVPAGLNWDLWLGPAPVRPWAAKIYHPFFWRGWWDFGGGKFSDMACHHMDLPHWALELDAPTSIEAKGPAPHPDCPPEWTIADYQYPAKGGRPAVHLTWYHGDKRPAELSAEQRKKWGAGTLFIGEKGMLLADYGKHVLLPEADFKDYAKPAKSIAPSIGHHREWIKGCKEGTPTTCNFDYSGNLAEAVLLGNVAFRSGKKLEWDSAAFKITNTREADEFVTKEYRKGWVV